MGWAIKRPDGTYRCWNANAQDDVLQPGEIWEALNLPPLITMTPSPSSLTLALDALLASTEPSPRLRAMLIALKPRT